MSLLFEKWKKQTNNQQQRQRLKKTDWNVHRLTWLILRAKGPWTSNKLLIDSKKCNPDFRIALAHRFDWISHNFKCRTFKLNCNKASASHYNDCLGTRSKASSYINLLMTAFLSIFRRFPTTFRRFPKIFQNCSEGQTNVPEHFPWITENSRRFPKTFEEDPKMFRWYTNKFKETKLISEKLSISSHVKLS